MSFMRRKSDWPRFRRDWVFNRLCNMGILLTRICRNFEGWGLTKQERNKLLKATAVLHSIVQDKERSETLLTPQITIHFNPNLEQ